jgi:hypothetical protein
MSEPEIHRSKVDHPAKIEAYLQRLIISTGRAIYGHAYPKGHTYDVIVNERKIKGFKVHFVVYTKEFFTAYETLFSQEGDSVIEAMQVILEHLRRMGMSPSPSPSDSSISTPTVEEEDLLRGRIDPALLGEHNDE